MAGVARRQALLLRVEVVHVAAAPGVEEAGARGLGGVVEPLLVAGLAGARRGLEDAVAVRLLGGPAAGAALGHPAPPHAAVVMPVVQTRIPTRRLDYKLQQNKHYVYHSAVLFLRQPDVIAASVGYEGHDVDSCAYLVTLGR